MNIKKSILLTQLLVLIILIIANTLYNRLIYNTLNINIELLVILSLMIISIYIQYKTNTILVVIAKYLLSIQYIVFYSLLVFLFIYISPLF